MSGIALGTSNAQANALGKAPEIIAEGDQIIVTATRRAVAIGDEPIAISVIAPDKPARLLIDHPAELLNRAPGILVQAGSGQEHLTALRSPVLTGGAGAGSFLYLQDGVPLRSAGFANVNGLFDAQMPFASSIEVVRGPGEVTYGSNAVHGAINVITQDPLGAARKNSQVTMSAGSFGRYSAAGMILRRAEDAGFIAGLYLADDGGYRDDSGLTQTKGFLAKGWRRGARVIRMRLSLHRLAQETAGFVRGDNAYRDDALRRTNPNPDAFRDANHGQFAVQIDDQIGAWEVQTTPYALWTDMRFRMHFLPSQAIEDNQHTAIGLLSSAQKSIGPTSLLVGLDAEAVRGSLREEQFIPRVFSYTPGVHYDYQVTSNSIAPFMRIRHQITPRLFVQSGARLTHTRYEYDNRIGAGLEGRFLRLPDRKDDFTAISGKLAAHYQFSDRLSAYASMARSARPPQTTDLYRLQINQTSQVPDPEALDMAEFGVHFSGPRVRADAAVYQGRKKNFLFRDADGFTVSNGVTTHQGIEVAGEVLLSERLRIRANGAWALHEYDFTNIVSRDSEVITPGNRVDTAPKTLANLRVLWTPHPKFESTLSVSHVGAYFIDAANAHSYPGHAVADITFGYALTDRVRIDGTVKNLTDARFATRADFAFGQERFFPGEQRAGKIALTIDF